MSSAEAEAILSALSGFLSLMSEET